MAMTFMDRLISDLKDLAKSLTDHINDLTAKLHITATERTNWNAAKSSIDTHANKTDIHLTTTEKTKVGYLSTTTSDVQVQLNSKCSNTLAHANAVVVTDGNKKITSQGTVTTTELGYLDGASSNIQQQLNAKAPSSHVGDSTHITSTERTNWNAASTHVSDTIKHITATERTNWNAKSNLYIVEGTYTCSGDQNNTVVYVSHGKSTTPKMVFAYMESYTQGSGGDDDMAATGPVTLYVFATVPMESGKASTTKIALLIPDVTTSSQTKIHWTALF